MTEELTFDRARFDAGEMPTRTRDGRKVLHVHDQRNDDDYGDYGDTRVYPLVAYILPHGKGTPEVYTHTLEGRWKYGQIHGADLVHEPLGVGVKAHVQQAKEEVAAWPQWMRDAAREATASRYRTTGAPSTEDLDPFTVQYRAHAAQERKRYRREFVTHAAIAALQGMLASDRPVSALDAAVFAAQLWEELESRGEA